MASSSPDGAELEQPFGTEAADISLLHIGTEICDDLDGVLRTAERIAQQTAPRERSHELKKDNKMKMDLDEAEEDDAGDEGDDAGDDDGGDEGGDDAGGDDAGGDDAGGDGGDVGM